jgi:glycosyltransferase involved in cell wall biosynthesis
MRAFQRVSNSIHSRLVILGEGPDRAALQELAEELGIADRVWLAGFQTNPFSFIAHSSCYVLSSRFEGLPGGLIEALACGTSVVSTDCPSGPDEVLESGKYGILTPIGDVEAISAGIKKVLNGDGIVPPAESWQKFRDVISIDDYERILLP